MDENELEKILKEYNQELNNLETRRNQESEKLSKLSADELAKSLENDFKEVLLDAQNKGVTIGIVPLENNDNDNNDKK